MWSIYKNIQVRNATDSFFKFSDQKFDRFKKFKLEMW